MCETGACGNLQNAFSIATGRKMLVKSISEDERMPLSVEREIYTPKNSTLVCSTEHPLGKKDLGFRGIDTQRATHCIHPYVAAINPPLVCALTEHFVPKGGSILDPYCGGGGVLVEGIINGFPVTGNDINPLAISISKAKTTYLPKDITKAFFERVMAIYERISVADNEIEAIPQTVRYWFKEYMLEPILKIKKSIDEANTEEDNEKESLGTLFKVIFSATIRDIMLTYRGEVRLRKLQGLDLNRFNPDVMSAFKKRAEITIERVNELPVGAKAEISLADSRAMPYKDNQFSTIICSPPYGDDKNGVGYFQFSSKMLYFLGYEDLKEYKKQFLGGDKGNKEIPPSDSLLESLENVYWRNQIHYKEAVAFYSDYYMALKEMKRVASDRIIIVIGNRVLSRTAFENAKITVEMFEHLGLDLECYFQRTLPKKRIANLGGDGGGGKIEHILVFKH